MQSKILTALSSDLCVRAYAIDSTAIVERARQIHNLSKLSCASLGRTLSAASLMGSMLQGNEDSLTVQIKGDGPLGRILAVSDSFGNPRGYVQNPEAELPLNSIGKIDVGGGVGSGTLSVIKDLGLKEPYIGQVPLVTGEIAEDITSYFAISEQVPSVCALGVLVDRDYSIKAAGGYILQLMPFTPDEVISRLEEGIKNAPPVSTMIEKGMSLDEILKAVMPDFGLEIVQEREVNYLCNCSHERVERALLSLGRIELSKMAEEKDDTVVSCHFCDKVYSFDKVMIEEMIERLDN